MWDTEISSYYTSSRRYQDRKIRLIEVEIKQKVMESADAQNHRWL